MTASHDEFAALAPAYALGALDAGERRAFEAHLDACSDCAADVAALGRVTLGLAQTVAPRTPRPELRGRVLAAVGAPGLARGGVHLPTRPASEPAGPPAARDARSWLPYAAVVVLAATLAAFAWDSSGRLREIEARLARADDGARLADVALIDARRAMDEAQAVVAVLTAPDVATVTLAGEAAAPDASARAFWSRERGMVFTASHLPALPEGRVYQVWVVTADAPVSAGLLTPDADGRASTLLATPPDIAAPVAIAVTLEEAGGVDAPTGEPLLRGAVS